MSIQKDFRMSDIDHDATELIPCCQCFKDPLPTFDGADVIFECVEHGHKAMGTGLMRAIANWNTYIEGVRKEHLL